MLQEQHFLFFGTPTDEGRIILDSLDSRHATKVLRLGRGDRLRLTDGAGTLYECRLDAVSRDCAEAIVESSCYSPPLRPRLTLFVGLAEREHFETLLELVTPLGVAAIVPIQCSHCQRPWWKHKWGAYEPRFTRKIVGATKQSLRLWLPELHAPKTIENAVHSHGFKAYVADENGRTFAPSPAPHSGPHASEIAAFVGPPGGFSSEELELLRKQQAQAVSLSPNRLRTELAATVMCAILMGGARREACDAPPVSGPGT